MKTPNRRFFLRKYVFFIAFIPFWAGLTTGCGLLFGSNKVDNKSDNYTVYRLDRESDHWKRIKGGDSVDKNFEEEVADMAFEHIPSGAIISLNSVCREYRDTSLEELSKHLIMGLPNVQKSSYRDIQVDGVDARETTVDTKDSRGVIVRVRTIVLRKSDCTFDLMYICDADKFEKHEKSFSRFVRGFHVD